ncbi:MAG: hypothetical protein HY726_22100 [Candidatus Rokubacteria bacterium]|nr:hypothetical protein [Candidatus Rokubacteria bacterium]
MRHHHTIPTVGLLLWGLLLTVPVAEAQDAVKAILTPPPLVPPPVDRVGRAKVVVTLETTEAKGALANDVEYTFTPTRP